MKRKLLERVRKLIPADRPAIRITNPNPFLDEVMRACPTVAHVFELLEYATKTISYPFPQSRLPCRSTYDILAERHVLEAVFDPELLERLRLRQFHYASDQREISLRQHRQQGYSLEFHERMLKLTMRHMREIKAVVTDAGVDERWAEEYLSGALQQLRKDFLVLYPFHPWQGDIKPISFGDFVRSVHAVFAAALEKRRAKGARALATHLTAAFCTPLGLLRVRKLKPTPEAVRKLLSRGAKPGGQPGRSFKIQHTK